MTKTTKNATATPLVRCAIYTRKSTEEGLEQEFNSLDAQREASEAYIASQRSEGWTCLPTRYDDGGFTGGNMDRPALKRLLEDMEAGQVDAVVCYKLDRFSRSLLDFAKMMEVFDKQKVAFVSITQQFSTGTSMGRLVLNVLLSFAQFEREIIAERTRDKATTSIRLAPAWSSTPRRRPGCAASSISTWSTRRYCRSCRTWNGVAGPTSVGRPKGAARPAASRSPRPTCTACSAMSPMPAGCATARRSTPASTLPSWTPRPSSACRRSCAATATAEASRCATSSAPCSGACYAASPAAAR